MQFIILCIIALVKASLQCVFSYAPLDFLLEMTHSCTGHICLASHRHKSLNEPSDCFIQSMLGTVVTIVRLLSAVCSHLLEMTHSCIGHIHLVSLRCVFSYAVSDHFSWKIQIYTDYIC